MNYILDTNICIYIIKKKPESVLEKLNEKRLGIIGISVITVSELFYGVRKSLFPEKNLEALKNFLIPFEIFQFDLILVESVMHLYFPYYSKLLIAQ